MKHTLRLVYGVITLLFLSAPALRAQFTDLYWHGDAGDHLWNTDFNWTTDESPNFDTARVIFANVESTPISIQDGTHLTNVGVISFTGYQASFLPGAGNYVFTLAGQEHLIISAGITNSSGFTQTFNLSDTAKLTLLAGSLADVVINHTGTGEIHLTGSSTAGSATLSLSNGSSLFFADSADGGTAAVTVGAGSTLDVSGLISGAISFGSIAGAGDFKFGSKTVTVGGNNRSTTVSGAIADGGVGGGTGASLVKEGTGALVLSGANTYTGTTTVNAGTLQFALPAALSNAGNLTVAAGAMAAFNVGGGTEFDATAIDAVLQSANFQAGAALGLDTSHGNFTYGLDLADSVNGALGLHKLGTGTLTLSGANTYSGGTFINQGVLQISSGDNVGSGGIFMGPLSSRLWITGDGVTLYNNITNGNSVIQVDPAHEVTLAGNIDLAGLPLTFTGAGLAHIAGVISNNGSVTADAASLTFDNYQDYAGATILRDGGSLTLTLSDAMPTTVRSALVLDDFGSGGSTFSVNDNNNATVASLAGQAGTSTVDLSNGGGLLIGTDGGTTEFLGAITGTGGRIAKDGASVQILSGTNTYTGSTAIFGGTLQFAHINSLPIAANLTVFSGGTAAFNVGGGDFSAGNIDAILNTASFQDHANLGLDTTNGDFIYGSSLTDTANGVLGFLKSGANTLTLTGVNTYTGGTTVMGGTLLAGNATAFVSGTTGADYAINGGTLDLGGFNLTMSSLAGSGGTVTVGSAALTVDQGTDTTFAGALTGNGSLSRSGSGILTLSGTNTAFVGTMTVNTGSVLQFSQVAAAPVDLTHLTVASGAMATFNVGGLGEFGQGELDGILTTVNFQAGSRIGLDTTNGDSAYGNNIADPIGGSLGLTKLGTNTFELSGWNSYTGDTNINGGILRLSGSLYGDGTYAGAIYVNNGGTLVIARDNVFLAHDSTPAATITINEGGLVMNGGDNFNTLNNLTLNGGELRAVGGADNVNWPAWQLKGTVTVGGSVASSITVNSVEDPLQTAIQLGNNTPGGATTFQIADVTGDDRTDLLIQNVLVDGHDTNANDPLLPVASSLVKTGAGTLTLVGDNLYTGGTTITGGILQLGDNSATGSVVGNITNNSVLLFDRSDVSTYGGDISGSGLVVQAGVGRLVLSGTNTYGGSTNVAAGTLQFTRAGALASAANLFVGYGTTAAFNVGGINDFDANGIATVLGAATFDFSASLGLDTTNGDFIYGNVILDSSNGRLGLVKFGANTLTLTGANTYTGDTTVAGGSLILAGAGTLGDGSGGLTVANASVDLGGATIAAHDVFVDGGVISHGTINSSSNYSFQSGNIGAVLGGTAGVSKFGAGTVTLTGANSYSGGTYLYEGTLALAGAGTLGTGDVTVTGSSTLDLTGLTGSLSLGAISGDGTFNLGSVALTTTTNNPYLSLSGSIIGTGSLTQTGTGYLSLSGTNTYTGGTNINGGTIQFDTTAALPATGALAVGPGGTAMFNIGTGAQFSFADVEAFLAGNTFASGANVGLFLSNASLTYSTPLTDTGGGTRALGLVMANGTLTLTGNNSYSGGTMVLGGNLVISANNQLGAASGGLTLRNGVLTTTTDISMTRAVVVSAGSFRPAVTTTLTLSGPISGSGGLLMGGYGTLLLTGANSYSDGTTINSGTLALSGGGTLGDGTGDLLLWAGTRLDFGGTTQSVDNLTLNGGTLNGGGTLNVAGHIVAAYGNVSVSLGGSADLTKNGDPYLSLYLSGANTFTGNTSIQVGHLGLGNDLALQGSTLVYDNSGGDVFFTTTAPVLGGLSGNKNLALDANGTPIALTVGANNSTTTYAGTLSGAGSSLTKAGTGTFTLTGANTYDGGTTVSAGMLQFANLSALPATGTFAVMSGATAAFNIGASGEFTATEINPLLTGFQAGSFLALDASHGPTDSDPPYLPFPVDVDASGLTGNVGMVALGSGFVQLSGNLTYTGDTVVRGVGTLGIHGQMDATLHGTNITVGLEAGDNASLVTYDGGVIRATNVTAGAVTGSEGQINVSGNFTTYGQLLATNLYIGGAGTGRFAVGNTGTATTVNTVIGRDAGSTGYAVSAGQGNWTNSGNIIVGESGTGQLLTFTSGTVASATVVLGANASGIGTLGLSSNGRVTTGQVVRGLGAATVNFDGGILRATADQGSFFSGFSTGNVHLLSGGGSIDSNGHDIGISVGLVGSGGLTKIGTGTLTLSGANTYSGGTTINAGTLALGASNSLLTTGALTLNGGTFALGGYNQTLGTLTLNAISTIDFGAAAGANTLSFGDSHLLGWTGTLSVLNYNSATDSLRFGTDSSGLTVGQLAQISLNGGAAALNASGFVVAAIPEPSTYAMLLGVGALGLAMWRRRLAATKPARA